MSRFQQLKLAVGQAVLCRWLDRHVDELHFVGLNPGKDCRRCKRTGVLTPTEIKMYLLGGGDEDEVAVEPTKT